MHSQLQTLIAALASIKDQNQVNQTAQILYKSENAVRILFNILSKLTYARIMLETASSK